MDANAIASVRVNVSVIVSVGRVVNVRMDVLANVDAKNKLKNHQALGDFLIESVAPNFSRKFQNVMYY